MEILVLLVPRFPMIRSAADQMIQLHSSIQKKCQAGVVYKLCPSYRKNPLNIYCDHISLQTVNTCAKAWDFPMNRTCP